MKILPIWRREDGSVISCNEKIKVMRENFEEIRQITQDAFEDGLLLEVSEAQIRKTLHNLVDQLVNPYQKQEAVIEKNYLN